MKKNKDKAVKDTVTVTEEVVPRAPGTPMVLKRELIRFDPDQPRKSFSDESLKEMADSIRTNGVIQRLVVSHEPAEFSIEPPDLIHPDRWAVRAREGGDPELFEHENHAILFCGGEAGLKDYYLLICGERRLRGCDLAGLTDIPCEVHENVTERERRNWQLIENMQRENVTAIEEAVAMERTLADRRATNPEYSVGDLAGELGISRAAAYGRMVLTRLHPPVREALVAGKISTSVAAVVAQVPDPKEQEKLLTQLMDEDDADFPFSVRSAQDLVDYEYVKQLDSAPFDRSRPDYLNDGELISDDAVLPACKVCQYRTGNMVEEFPDLKARPNVCTRPACYGEKCKQHWQEKAKDEAQTGKTVLTELEFRKEKKHLVAADKCVPNSDSYGTFEHLMGKKKPEPVLVATAEGLQTFYRADEAIAAVKKNGHRVRSNDPADKAEAERKQKEAEALSESRKALYEELVPELMKGLNKIGDKEGWELLAAKLQDPSHGRIHKAAIKLAKGNRARVLINEILPEIYHVADYRSGDWDKDLLELAGKLGVDLEAEEKKRAPKTPELPPQDKDGDLFPSAGKLKVKKAKTKKRK